MLPSLVSRIASEDTAELSHAPGLATAAIACLTNSVRHRSELSSACRYAGVGHLGPFEAPAQVAERALVCFKLAESHQHWHSLPKEQRMAFRLQGSRL